MPSFASPPTLVHPAAELFPLLEGDDLARLADDIARNGLLEPLVAYDGLLLDGRNRRRACQMAGVEPQYVEWQGECGSPVAFIAARNLHRRHLSESQRAALAARVKGMFEEEAAERQRARQFGSPRKNRSPLGGCIEKPRESTVCADLHRPCPSNDRAAAMFNVSARLVALASRVIDQGDPLLLDAINAGQATVSDAAAVLSLAKEDQRSAVAAIRSGQARTLRQAAKANRASREAASRGVPGLPLIDESERHSPQRVRRVAKCFEAQCETLARYIELAGSACGGTNDYTRRMREGLEQIRRIMRECSHDFGRRKRPTR
jgi:ParB-like chromosome segregation protein Spo0J